MAKHLELANHFANFSQKSRFIFGSVEAFFFAVKRIFYDSWQFLFYLKNRRKLIF